MVESQEAQAGLADCKSYPVAAAIAGITIRPPATSAWQNNKPTTAESVELPISLCEFFKSPSGQGHYLDHYYAGLEVMLRHIPPDTILRVGTAVANRRMRETENLIGMIVSNLVLRTDLSGNPTFRELLGRVRQVSLEAFANEDLPFDKVVEVLKPIRNLSYICVLSDVQFP